MIESVKQLVNELRSQLYCPRCARRINEGYHGATPLVNWPTKEEAERILTMAGMTKQQQEAELAKQYEAKSEPDRLRGAGWCKYQLNGWFIWETPKDGKVVWDLHGRKKAKFRENRPDCA